MTDPTRPPTEELDLTSDPPLGGGVPTPIERAYDPEPEREMVRARIAQGLTLVVGALAILAFVLIGFDVLSPDEIEPLQIFFTPLITLCATALGFYFGGKHS